MRVIHISMDVQDRYLKPLSPYTKKTYPIAARAFADELRDMGVPTIWVGWDRAKHSFKYYSHKATGPTAREKTLLRHSHRPTGRRLNHRTKDLSKTLGLKLSEIKTGEDIFYKGDDNAFDTGYLGKMLKAQKVDLILLSGLNTGACIVQSLMGGLKEGFTIVVVSDLLADRRGERLRQAFWGNAPWHIDRLDKMLLVLNHSQKIEYAHMTREDIRMAFASGRPDESLKSVLPRPTAG
ncbi:MAG: isochorismatase family protein [Alphaproteobacteria bacterium]|nr:isochorismatase family protein [Alphaproteobacteria bacterium]